MTARDERRLILEHDFTRLIRGLAAKIDQTNLDMLNEFVQNYEYGIALDWLQSLIDDRSIVLTDQQTAEIQRLKRLMNSSLDTN